MKNSIRGFTHKTKSMIEIGGMQPLRNIIMVSSANNINKFVIPCENKEYVNN